MCVVSLFKVQAWARQHQQRLATALTDLLATQELLENLLTWLQWAETNLNDKDKEPLPQEIEEVKSLIAEHQVNKSADKKLEFILVTICSYQIGISSTVQRLIQSAHEPNWKAHLLLFSAGIHGGNDQEAT